MRILKIGLTPMLIFSTAVGAFLYWLLTMPVLAKKPAAEIAERYVRAANTCTAAGA